MDSADDHFNQGEKLRKEGRVEEAVDHFERAVVLSQGHPRFLYALAPALEAVGRHWEAVGIMKTAVKLAVSPSGMTALAMLLLRDGKYGEAVTCAERALELDPLMADARIVFADALRDDGRVDEADEQVRLARETDPYSEDRYALTRANRLQFTGRLDEAAAAYEEVLQRDPSRGDAFFGLVACGRGVADRYLIERMFAALQDPRLGIYGRSMVRFALGRSLDSDGRYSEAMTHFDEANRLRRELSRTRFDRNRFESDIDATLSTYAGGSFESELSVGVRSELPIFIVGMMRSGTTLAERILSAHPEVGAAGELDFWTRNEPRIVDRATGSFDSPLASEYAEAYCRMLSKMSPSSTRVTDKNPANFLVLGLIRRALPRARIIHMRRHPVDTCLSIYMTPVDRPPDFSLDRDNIVFAYKQYLRLMEHWRRVLPPERFLEIDYEELVADPGSVIPRMVEFCGLEWDEACLHPEASRARVDTPSYWQVRRPVNIDSVGRWKRYEPWLGAFRELLGDSVQDPIPDKA